MEPEGSSPCSQKLATGFYPELAEPSHHGMTRPQIAEVGKSSDYGG
jgi:hypothetical protein